MRVISGKYRGRKIHPPQNLELRPTTDFAKEALFNILNNKIDWETCKVLDLFCGTGNILFEFISRDVESVKGIDINSKCIQFINETLGDWNEILNGQAYKDDVFNYINKSNQKFDLIFADPPYDLPKLKEIPTLIFNKKLLNENGILVVEHGPDIAFFGYPNYKEQRKYGNVHFSFFEL